MAGGAIAAGLATVSLIGIILAIKAFKKGVDKVKDINQLRDDELSKVDIVVQKLENIEIFPDIGKVESINFYLNANDESVFYDIQPAYLKRLRPKLEKLLDKMEEDKISYGYKYAERNFYIGNELIFSWKNEVKI